MNAYDPKVHGVCGWARPVWPTDRCSCGLQVRFIDGEWLHWVDADDFAADDATPPAADVASCYSCGAPGAPKDPVYGYWCKPRCAAPTFDWRAHR